MDKKKGKVKPVKSTIEVVDEKYESHLDLEKSKVETEMMSALWESASHSPIKKNKAIKMMATQFKECSVGEAHEAPPDAPKYYYSVVDTTDGKAIEILPPPNKKPVKKKKAYTLIKGKIPPTILQIKKKPKPPKRVERIIREKDFEFPRVRKQNTLRIEKEPLASMEGDELRDIEALEIKI